MPLLWTQFRYLCVMAILSLIIPEFSGCSKIAFPMTGGGACWFASIAFFCISRICRTYSLLLVLQASGHSPIPNRVLPINRPWKSLFCTSIVWSPPQRRLNVVKIRIQTSICFWELAALRAGHAPRLWSMTRKLVSTISPNSRVSKTMSMSFVSKQRP